MFTDDDYRISVQRRLIINDHIKFTRLFFKHRYGSKFKVNWHHEWIAHELQQVLLGKTKNLIINVSPGSSKTELVVINFIARGIAINPYARFLHLSYSDDLSLLNSESAREIVNSEEFQELWPLRISVDAKAKKRWNVTVDGMRGGGVYATSLGGQVTGFRAGHMIKGFQGAIIVDDPLKPEDAFSKTKLMQANRKLITTVKSRRASPDTPTIIIMQRVSANDTTQFIKDGALPGKWRHLIIPAMMTDAFADTVPEPFRSKIDRSVRDKKGRFSYWEFKEPIEELNQMETGGSSDKDGNIISRHVFNAQYQQNPVEMGGNILKGEYYVRYKEPPKLDYRYIYADTAQKTAERNDYSVLQCFGYCSENRKLYLLDQVRGKWEAPELERKTVEFWVKHRSMPAHILGNLREMRIEDKSSGTGLVQSIRAKGGIPVKGIERHKDRYTRVTDALPYIEAKMLCVPEDAVWLSDYIAEHEAYTAEDTHAHDDQIDPTIDAVNDILSLSNKLAVWERVKTSTSE